MKQVLLTGASGFIGRQAIQPLVERGFEVHCICHSSKLPSIFVDSKQVIWHRVDLLDWNDTRDLFGSLSPTHLLHLAWDVTPGSYLESINNYNWLISSLYLFQEFAKSGGKKIVCAGTCFEYDLQNGYCNECLTPIAPATFYGSCKSSLHSIGEKFAEKAGYDFAWGRIFFMYGPHEYPMRLVPSVINSLLRGEAAQCTHGNQIRDFLHVADVANAFVSLLDSDVNGVVNIGSGAPVSIKELVLQIGKQIGGEKNISFGSIPVRQNEPPVIVADNNRLKNEMGWKPKYTLEEGIRDTIAGWKKQEARQ